MIKKLAPLTLIAITLNTPHYLHAMSWYNLPNDRFADSARANHTPGTGTRQFEQPTTRFTHPTGTVSGKTFEDLSGGVQKYPDRHSRPGFEHETGTPYKPEYQINNVQGLHDFLKNNLTAMLATQPGLKITEVLLGEENENLAVIIRLQVQLRETFKDNPKADNAGLDRLQRVWNQDTLPTLKTSITQAIQDVLEDKSVAVNIELKFI